MFFVVAVVVATAGLFFRLSPLDKVRYSNLLEVEVVSMYDFYLKLLLLLLLLFSPMDAVGNPPQSYERCFILAFLGPPSP